MCLAATFANLPIYTIFDTYFQFYFWPKRKKRKKIFWGSKYIGNRILTPFELGGPPEMPNNV